MKRKHKDVTVPLKLRLRHPREIPRKVTEKFIEEEVVLDSSEHDAMVPTKKRKCEPGKTEEEIIDGNDITPAPSLSGKIVKRPALVS